MAGPPPPGWGSAPSGPPAGGTSTAPPGWGPPPSAPAGPQRVPWMVSGATEEGVKVLNPATPTEGNLSKYQQDAQLTEELGTLLNSWKQTLDAEAMRNEKTKDIDKAVRLEMNAPLTQRVGETLNDRWELWKYDPSIMGHRLHMGLGSDLPSGQIFLTARLRSRLTPETLKNTSVRAYKAIEKVEEHYPYASDSMKEKYDKYQWWASTVNDAKQQLEEQGVPVKAGQPIISAPQNVSAETLSRASEPTAPPFTPINSAGNSLDNLRLQDPNHKWWYWNVERSRWQQFGE